MRKINEKNLRMATENRLKIKFMLAEASKNIPLKKKLQGSTNKAMKKLH